MIQTNGQKYIKEKVILFAVIFVYFITMYYADNQIIFEAAYDRLEWLCQGKIMDFLFDWSPIVPYSVYSQFLFTLWVVPVKILSVIFKTPLENSVGAYLWYKLSMAICFWAVVRETQKTAEVLNMDKERVNWVGLFTVSSLFAVLPVFHLAQVDAIYLPFMVYGVRKYMEGDYKRFLIAFLIANPVKYLAVFVFVPLILLKEKKILYILRDFAIGLVLAPAEIVMKNMTTILYLGGV